MKLAKFLMAVVYLIGISASHRFATADKPDMLQASPVGRQLHCNDRPQENHFRALILTEHPGPEPVTVSEN